MKIFPNYEYSLKINVILHCTQFKHYSLYFSKKKKKKCMTDFEIGILKTIKMKKKIGKKRHLKLNRKILSTQFLF